MTRARFSVKHRAFEDWFASLKGEYTEAEKSTMKMAYFFGWIHGREIEGDDSSERIDAVVQIINRDIEALANLDPVELLVALGRLRGGVS